MRHLDGYRHHGFRLIAGITKHQTLVPRTLISRQISFLFMQEINDLTFIIKTLVRISVAYVADHFPHDWFHIDDPPGIDLSGKYHLILCTQRFAGNSAKRFLPQISIQNSVRYPVANFVRMTLGYRFGSEYITALSGWLGM